MRRARLVAPRQVQIMPLELPPLGPAEVLVGIAYCGICGSDLHEFAHGPYTDLASSGVFGHEWSGRVLEAGSAVSRFRPGDRVTGYAVGAYGDAIVVREERLLPLPDSVSDEQGALVEPTAVAVHAVRKAALQLGEHVFIAGAGPIGLLTLLAARNAGAARIVVSEHAAGRRALATELGADVVLDPFATDFAARLTNELQAEKADAAFECVGRIEALQHCLGAVRRGGRVTIVGVFDGPISLNLLPPHLLDLSIHLSMAYPEGFGPAIALIAGGRIPSQRLISHIIGIEDLVEGGINQLLDPASGEAKILVRP